MLDTLAKRAMKANPLSHISRSLTISLCLSLLLLLSPTHANPTNTTTRGEEKSVYIEGIVEDPIPTIYMRERLLKEVQDMPCHNGTEVSLNNRKLLLRIALLEDEIVMADTSSYLTESIVSINEGAGESIKISRSAADLLVISEGQQLSLLFSPSLLLLNPSSNNGELIKMDIFERNYQLKCNVHCKYPSSLPNNIVAQTIVSNSFVTTKVPFPAYGQVVGLLNISTDIIVLNYHQLAAIGLTPPYPFIEISHFSRTLYAFPSLSPRSDPIKKEPIGEYGKVLMFGSFTINANNANSSLGERYKVERDDAKRESDVYAQKTRSLLSSPKKSKAEEEIIITNYFNRGEYQYSDLAYLPSNSLFLSAPLAAKIGVTIGDYVLFRSTITHEMYLLKQQIKLLSKKH